MPLMPLLALLCTGGAHGYALKHRVERDFSPYWSIDYAQLYRTLGRASREGLVVVDRDATHIGPPRKVYRLTGAGRLRVAQWLDSASVDRTELLIKARLIAEHGPASSSWWVAQQESGRTRVDACRRRLQCTQRRVQGVNAVLSHAALKDEETALEALWDAWRLSRPGGGLVVAGSDDPLLSRIVRSTNLGYQTSGSFGGLWALANGTADIAALHLCDPDTGAYNASFLRRLLPEGEWALINLAWRDTGLMVAPGNPLNIRDARDLARPEVRLVNRQSAAGTRMMLYQQLAQVGIRAASLKDWGRGEFSTHDQVARCVAAGEADAGPGLRAVAERWELSFIPLAQERYDLAMRLAVLETPTAAGLVELLRGTEVKRWASHMAGYDLGTCGDTMAICH